MPNPATVHDVIASLYRVTAGVDKFDSFLVKTGELLNSNVVALLSTDQSTGITTMPHYIGLAHSDIEEFNEGYAQENEVIRAFTPGLLRGEVVSSSDKFSDLQISRTKYYADYLQRIDVAYLCATQLAAENSIHNALAVNRARTCGAYTEEEVQTICAIKFHLNNAIQVESKIRTLATESSMKSSALELLTLGVCFIGSNLEILHANGSAQRILADGTVLKSRSGRLVVGPLCHKAVSRLLARMASRSLPAGRHIQLPTEIPGTPTFVAVFPIISHDFVAHWLPSNKPRFVVFLGSQEVLTKACVEQLQDVFQLTPSETALTGYLMQYPSLKTAACKLQMSHETARSHLRSIFQKLDVHSQAELMVYVCRMNSLR